MIPAVSPPVLPAVLLLVLAAGPAFAGASVRVAPAASPLLEVDLPWTELEFGARKLIFSATVRISVESLPSGQALEEIVAAGGDLEGLLPSGETVDRIHTVASITMGKTEVVDTWIDASNGAVLQTIKETHGRSNYWKLRRFYADGYHEIREAPMDKKERKARRRAWTKHEERMIRWNPLPPKGAVVTSSYATIYLLSRSRFGPKRQAQSWFIPVRKGLVEIRLTAGNFERTRLRLDESWPRGSARLDTRLEAPTLRLSPRWLDDHKGGPAASGFMGMRGSAEITLLPGTGLPIRIDGRVRGAGHITSRLLHVRWK